MKKTALCVLFAAALIFGLRCDQAYPCFSANYYDGIYVDLIAQAEYEAWRESKDPSKQSAYILKVDKKTGLPVCMTTKQGNRTEVYTSFYYNGVKYDLRFENNVLAGARKSCPEERAALAAELGTSWDTLSDEQREIIDQQAFEIIWSSRSWVAEPEALKPLLEDYAAQVQAVSRAARSAEK